MTTLGLVFETLVVQNEGPVLFVDIAAPPMNLLGVHPPETPRCDVPAMQRGFQTPNGELALSEMLGELD
jgi:hypothetical protein